MAVAAFTSIPWEREAPAGESCFELVDDHFPLLFLSFGGELVAQHVLQLIRFVDDARARARSEGVELLAICDARTAQLPSDLVREMVVDWLRHEEFGAPSQLGSIIVTHNVLLRGVVASIKWATKRGELIHVVPTPEAALIVARERFVAHGLPVPPVLDEVV